MLTNIPTKKEFKGTKFPGFHFVLHSMEPGKPNKIFSSQLPNGMIEAPPLLSRPGHAIDNVESTPDPMLSIDTEGLSTVFASEVFIEEMT